MLYGVCDEWDVELGEDTVPQMKVANILKRIFSKYNNSLPMIKWALISKSQVKYVEYIIVTRDTENFGILRKEVIQVISDIRQENYYVQAENHLYSLIWGNRLTNMKRHGRVIKYQATTTKKSQICMSQQ